MYGSLDRVRRPPTPQKETRLTEGCIFIFFFFYLKLEKFAETLIGTGKE